jgi:hypothetical protein
MFVEYTHFLASFRHWFGLQKLISLKAGAFQKEVVQNIWEWHQMSTPILMATSIEIHALQIELFLWRTYFFWQVVWMFPDLLWITRLYTLFNFQLIWGCEKFFWFPSFPSSKTIKKEYKCYGCKINVVNDTRMGCRSSRKLQWAGCISSILK